MLAGSNSTPLHQHLNRHLCRSSFQHTLAHLEQFMRAYRGRRRQFSITWLTYLAHDDNDRLQAADAHFERFLRRNQASVGGD